MKFGRDLHNQLVQGLLDNSIIGLRNAHRYFGSLRFMRGIPEIDDHVIIFQAYL